MSNQLTVAEAIQSTQEKFLKLAPKVINFDSEMGYAVQILSNNPYLGEVARNNPVSLQRAMVNVAAIGLSLNPVKKEAYLISRTIKVKSPNGGESYENRIFLEPSYMGICNIATGTGLIEWIKADVVYSEDEFIDNGAGEKPTHRYQAFKPRGEIVGVYCTAKLKSGDYLTGIMTKDEVNSIMEKSESVKSCRKKNKPVTGPWADFWVEMAKKTVVRRDSKMWPKTDGESRLDLAVHLSNENEGFEPLITEPDLGQVSAQQKNHLDRFIQKSDALGLHCFRLDTDEVTYTNLYHSFPKGQKGKYQKIMDDLDAKGMAMLSEIVDAVSQYAENGDELGAEEVLGELTPDELKAVRDRLSNEALDFIDNGA